MISEGVAYLFVAFGLGTGLLCGFVLGSIWAWRKEDQERKRRKEQGLDA